jgi:hypothetical protein
MDAQMQRLSSERENALKGSNATRRVRSQRAMNEDEATLLWNGTPTPAIEAEKNRLEAEAHEHGYTLNLSDLVFLAFWAGANAAENKR